MSTHDLASAPSLVAAVVFILTVVITWALASRRSHRATSQSLHSAEVSAARSAREAERQRWTRNLHDETMQQLAVLKILVSTAEQAPDLISARSSLVRARQLVEEQFGSLAYLIEEGRPAVLDRLGLVAALELLVLRIRTVNGISGTVTSDLGPLVESECPEAREADETVYRIAQEALSNAVKHGRPTSVTVLLTTQNEEIVLRIQDDGTGFSPADSTGGHGLQNMYERAVSVGGTLNVNSAAGRGTTIMARIPVYRPSRRASISSRLEQWLNHRGSRRDRPVYLSMGAPAVAVERYMLAGRWMAAVLLPVQFMLSKMIGAPFDPQIAGLLFSLVIVTLNVTLSISSGADKTPSPRRRIGTVTADAVITLAAISYMQFDNSSATWIGLLIVAVEASLTLSVKAARVAVNLLLLGYGAVLTGADRYYARPVSWAQLILAVTLTTALTVAALANRPGAERTLNAGPETRRASASRTGD